MIGTVDRDGLQRMVDEGRAQVVEVLPQSDYDWAHLPGAIHLSLKEFSPKLADERLDRARPVIVYCNNFT